VHALGSDTIEHRETFKDFIPLLPEPRRAHCGQEYRRAKAAFDKLVRPHVDAL
jgi:hypothetical protein